MEHTDSTDTNTHTSLAVHTVADDRAADHAAAADVVDAVLTRESIFTYAATARPLERVNLPWIGPGAHVFVQGLDAGGKDAFDDAVYTVDAQNKLVANVKGVRALMVCLCTVDADGKRLFTDKDLPKLATLDARTADAIYVKAARASNLTQRDVDDIVKNSESVRSGGR